MAELNIYEKEIQRRDTRKKCLDSLSEFVKTFWSTIIEDELEWSAHMQIMCDEIQVVYERVIKRQPKLHDLIINIPPGTSKSTICTVMAPAWSWARDSSLRHITGSYSADLSTEHAVKSRDIIKSDLYRELFPEVEIKKDEDNKTNYKTTNNGQRFATSVGGTVTGVHAHILTFDDPLNPKQAASAAEVKEANAYFDKTLPTRKVDKRITPLILVMQRLATNDPTGHLLEKKKTGIHHVCLPGEMTNNVKPEKYKEVYKSVTVEAGHKLGLSDQAKVVKVLDPIRLGPDVLAELRIDLGGDAYAGQIGQTPVQEGGLIWKKWFREVDDSLFPDISMASMTGTDWDLAYTSDEDNAASAYITAGKIGSSAYIFDLDYAFLEFPELIRYMKQRKAPHFIEAKASGKSAKQALTRAGVVAVEVKVMGGSDKVARAKMATPPAEAGMVFIKKSLADKLYNDERQGILNFPKGQLKDVADTLAQSLQRLFTGGLVIGTSTRSMLDRL